MQATFAVGVAKFVSYNSHFSHSLVLKFGLYNRYIKRHHDGPGVVVVKLFIVDDVCKVLKMYNAKKFSLVLKRQLQQFLVRCKSSEIKNISLYVDIGY